MQTGRGPRLSITAEPASFQASVKQPEPPGLEPRERPAMLILGDNEDD